ncbi:MULTISPECIES: peptidoglycan bridge formation glycyltransferase FemA/FemB family protein [Terrabacteria group]|uniref:lipid II:glycine glycyltransferase FemX n=1 Tax=Bacillati TaxID=1783272 RepID=UPI001C6DF080|nr:MULTISPECIES: peptidoglycan bridge formation glycyltransferase FemA/FemB family protein [Terrabacteria group]MBW9211864.1 aminoacyltransferase [Trueperella sp. zg.1013]
MKFLESLDRKIFDEFAIHSNLNHYSKTSNFIDLAKLNGYTDGDLLAVSDNQGNILATAVMVHKKYKALPIQYSYCQYGFNVDLEKKDVLYFLLEHLKEFAKKKGSCFLRIDPNVCRLEHEKDGRLKEGGFNQEWFTQFLIEQGFHHLGYNYGYAGNWMSRFTYVKDLDMEWKACLKSIKRQANYTAKNAERLVEVRKGSKQDLWILVQAQQELAKKLGFLPKKEVYFERFWDIYEEYARFYVVKTNYHQAKLSLETQLQEARQHILEIKDLHKVEIENKHIQALENEIQEIVEAGLDINQDVYLGAKFIIQQAEKVWNVYMYTNKTLMNFRAAFALHMAAMKDAYDQGAKSYDFEGVVGTSNPNDPMYGQQNFKKSFGGDFLEFVGEFDCVFQTKKYRFWQAYDRVLRGLRRRYARFIMRYKK